MEIGPSQVAAVPVQRMEGAEYGVVVDLKV